MAVGEGLAVLAAILSADGIDFCVLVEEGVDLVSILVADWLALASILDGVGLALSSILDEEGLALSSILDDVGLALFSSEVSDGLSSILCALHGYMYRQLVALPPANSTIVYIRVRIEQLQASVVALE